MKGFVIEKMITNLTTNNEKKIEKLDDRKVLD
jgi:hypothetical protein